METCMWRLTPHGDEWEIQTEESEPIRKMKRRIGFMLISRGLNSPYRKYRFHTKSRRNALITFQRLTGQVPIFNASEGVYLAKPCAYGEVKSETQPEFELQE